MRTILAPLLLILGSAAAASVPPMPPAHVCEAGEVLTSADGLNPAKVAPLFADDVKAFENGKPVADGKAAWLAWRRVQLAHYNGRTVGYSESSGGHEIAKGGELLVLDTYDTADRANLPPNVLVDPRMASRSTLYEFGADGLIHVVRIEKTGGFWMTPRTFG